MEFQPVAIIHLTRFKIFKGNAQVIFLVCCLCNFGVLIFIGCYSGNILCIISSMLDFFKGNAIFLTPAPIDTCKFE